jgi:hypothetical protein
MTREGKEREVTRDRKEVEWAGKECDLQKKSGRRARSGMTREAKETEMKKEELERKVKKKGKEGHWR